MHSKINLVEVIRTAELRNVARSSGELAKSDFGVVQLQLIEQILTLRIASKSSTNEVQALKTLLHFGCKRTPHGQH